MRLDLLTIEIYFSFFLDGRIIIKVEDILAWFYIQKWLQNFIKDLWINLNYKDLPPQCPISMNIIPCKINQM